MTLRNELIALLDSKGAHTGFDAAIEGVPEKSRGTRTEGGGHSLWELLEHIRLAQHDILDYCRNRDYHEPRWPEDYWPASPEPPSKKAWDESVAAVRRDLGDVKAIVADQAIDLLANIPGTKHTYLREVLLVADHNAYHVGQLVTTRRALGIWK